MYDWDMNPVKKFTLDKVNGTSLFIDRANGKVYSYDRSLDSSMSMYTILKFKR